MLFLTDSLTKLPGVGRTRAERFSALGLHTLQDLLRHFPRAYEDRTRICPLAELPVGEAVCFRAAICSHATSHYIRKGFTLTRVSVSDGTARIRLTFFNQPYRVDTLQYGREFYFYGALVGDDRGHQVVNPSMEPVDAPGSTTRRIVPIYPLTSGIHSALISRCIAEALPDCIGQLPEYLPQWIRQKYDVLGVAEAYRQIHLPQSAEEVAAARHRFCFEEFFLFSASLALLRSRRTVQNCMASAPADMSPFYAALPFSPTKDQRNAITDILTDLQKPCPMNRLVQGDVGCGKTIVAAAAIYAAVQGGAQVALMAPTEILAEQHHKTLEQLLSPLGVHCALLTGSMKAAQRRQAQLEAASGQAQLVIGTHALISGTTVFSKLGLVIADEQHRFGVEQRAALSAKGNHPHLLVLSATPIPRTLSMLLYGDLELSTIRQMPPGRQKIDTFLVNEQLRTRLNGFIRKQVTEGHQVYVICPAVEENEEMQELKSVEQWALTLRQAFPDLSIGLLHGRMKGTEKESIMADFKNRRLDILVSTTVVEVGVDVPSATLMVIENAERFGLSQLHQLRGRVGRGSAKSYCVLVSNTIEGDTRERLQALCRTNDGFAIAEADLKLRGPGDFFGSRQSGLPTFRTAGFQPDLALMTKAQQAAADFLEHADPSAPETALLLSRIEKLLQSGVNRLN